MQTTLLMHILAGSLALVFGYVALYAEKGATVHRKSGMLFVFAMVAMSLLGMVMAAGRGVAPAINIPAGALAAYLAITALATVRPPAAYARSINTGAMLVALTVGLASLWFAFEAIANGGKRDGMPSFPFLLFGIVGVLAAIGDIRMMRAGGYRGVPRLARHLWRMCFALFIAAMSFFLGQSDEFPVALRIPGLLALPVLAVLATMFYWLWRVRGKKFAPRVARIETARATFGLDATTVGVQP